ncbi:putative homoserine dehydrogenase [Helianthus debilis subsp. tardiflorus]
MSYFGANVLPSRTIIAVMQYDIPIVIRNIFNLSAPGTKNCRAPIIEAEVKQDSVAYVKGFETIDNFALVNVEGWFYRTGMAGVPGTASAIFAAVKDVGANVIMISQCPRQPGGTECGYYMMKFMKEIAYEGVEILDNDNLVKE